MERTPTKHRPPQISLILRTLCGAYLLYLAWDLRSAAVQTLRGEENLLFFQPLWCSWWWVRSCVSSPSAP